MAFSSAQIAAAQAAAAALLNAGMSLSFLPLALAQIAHETGGFTSRVMSEDNNLSGIKYIGKPTVQKNATQGRRSPEGNYYAHFASTEAWARDYIRIVSMGTNPPIKATDTATFAQRLKDNHYYGDTVSNYTRGLNSWLSTVQPIASTATSQKKSLSSTNTIIITSFLLAAIIYIIYQYKLRS